MVENSLRNVHALWIMVYCLIISTAFGLQIFESEEPCPLCYLQRVAMLLVCCGALMNLVFGFKPKHHGLIVLASLFGASVSIRQILLHICPTFPKFGVPFWGYSLYTWSFLTFASSLLLVSLLLFVSKFDEENQKPLNSFQKISVVWLVLVIVGNLISVSIECGIGFCPE